MAFQGRRRITFGDGLGRPSYVRPTVLTTEVVVTYRQICENFSTISRPENQFRPPEGPGYDSIFNHNFEIVGGSDQW